MTTFLAQNQFMNSSPPAPRDESAVVSKPPADATAVPISDGQDVPAQMQESKARHSGLARDDEKPGDTMQESRPAHPATAPSEIEPSMTNGGDQEAPAGRAPNTVTPAGALEATDCIGEIFFYARKLMKGRRASVCSGCENPQFEYETVDGGALYRCADCGKGVHFSGADLAASSKIDEARLEAEIELPLFIRDGEHLRRWEA